MEQKTNIANILLKHGILYIDVYSNQTIDINDMEALIPHLEKICKNKKYPVLLSTGVNNKVTTAARRYIAEAFQKFRIAEAIVCTTFYHKLMAQLYSSVNKPDNPVRIFTDKEKAENWLRENFT